MGWDVKASAVSFSEALPTGEQLAALMPSPAQLTNLIAVAVGLALLYAMLRSSVGRRLTRGIEETVFSNWQLGLLGATGIVLSLASGYTTWDGMRNFTGEAVLSGMVTFGIQGVMLIVAWLIGETFAVGMNQRSRRRSGRPDDGRGLGLRRLTPYASAVVGILIFAALSMLVMQSFGGVNLKDPALVQRSWLSLADELLIAAVVLLVVLVLALNAGSDLVDPYIQSTRVMIKNAVLWVMFLACMATSVFFSFDSLFTAIFPQTERVRAAELRAQNQVAGLVADIGSTIATRRLGEAERMFDSAGWKTYDEQLAGLARAAQGSSDDIERYFNDRLEDRNRAIKSQQERIVTAQSGQTGLQSKKVQLTDELSRLKGERPGLAAEHAAKKTELDNRAKEIDAKRVEAMAEDRGVEGTGKVGKGPQYRARVDELAKLGDYYKIGEERVRDALKRLNAVDSRVSQIERELAQIDGELAKFKGEAETAEQRIKMAQEQLPAESSTRIDPARIVPAFETARADFRQAPEADKLAKVQQYCTQIYTAMATATPETKKKVASIDCDPKQASEAAAIVFALNAGIDTFQKACSGGDKLNQHTTADALFGFARKCLADSGLPSRDTERLRNRINSIELARDDKAHRFVVTWNAFSDGNKLAYLALALAIAIDGLVFMSGLFGANAIRSPLSDIENYKARSASQLEAIIDTALLPHTFETAQHVIGQMRPMTERDGYIARIVIDDYDAHSVDLRRVLSAGATIGAVRHDERQKNVYEVRAELYEYLSTVAKKAYQADKSHATLADLERTLQVALLPDVAGGSEIVLGYMHPVEQEKHGFTNEIDFLTVKDEDKRIVRNALNAGATLQKIQRASSTHYYIHGDYYKTLVRIRARLMASTAALPGRGSSPLIEGGQLTPAAPAIRQDAAPRHLAAAAGAAALKPSRQLQAPERADASEPRVLGADDEQQLYNTFVTRMLLDAELDPHQLAQIRSQALWQPALDAAKAVDSLHAARSRLGVEVSRREHQIRRSIDASQQALSSEFQDEPDVLQILDEAHRDVTGAIPALMLTRGGPLEQVVGRMIADLERAAAPDDGLRQEDEDLLRRLRLLRQSLARLDRQSADGWREMVSLVSDYDEMPPMPRVASAKH